MTRGSPYINVGRRVVMVRLEPELLDKLDFERYSRQLGLIHVEGQLKLLSSTVAVVGLGGLGSIAAYYLAASGVGRLILVDRDEVEVNNLNRQLLYTKKDVGKPKALAAASVLSRLNPDIEVVPIADEVDWSLARKLSREADIIVDSLDNWKTRLYLDRAAWLEGKPLVHAAAEGLYGQATTVKRGYTGCLACLAPSDIDRAGCQAILGPTVGLLGSIEAMEVIKLATGIGEPLFNKLLVVDARTYRVDEIRLAPMDCDECWKRVSDRLQDVF